LHLSKDWKDGSRKEPDPGGPLKGCSTQNIFIQQNWAEKINVLHYFLSAPHRRIGRRSENFAYQYVRYLKGPLTCRKILRHGISGFTSYPWPRPGLNSRPLGPVASTLTTTPPMRQ
jgi:hypothetical protein